MFKKSSLLIVFLLISVHLSYSQSSKNLEDINQVWEKFYQAFETLDYKPMAEIHSKQLVRIAGGKRILDYETYINNYKIRFKASKDNLVSNSISLRFFERINNDSIASERGIYRLIRNKGKVDEQTYYGQFHVIFAKENNDWKITMDYDSSESNTIGEKDYNKAYGITEFGTFTKD